MMKHFVIYDDNHIEVFSTREQALEDNGTLREVIATEESDLAHFAARQPIGRLVEIWNGFAGVPPFSDLKPVKKFTDRKTAVARIWKAIQALYVPPAAPQAADVAPKKARAKKVATAAEATPTTREGSKKAIVLDLLARKGGATAAEIMETTGWASHTVRGFISAVIGKKMGLTVESWRAEDGSRCYHAIGGRA